MQIPRRRGGNREEKAVPQRGQFTSLLCLPDAFMILKQLLAVKAMVSQLACSPSFHLFQIITSYGGKDTEMWIFSHFVASLSATLSENLIKIPGFLLRPKKQDLMGMWPKMYTAFLKFHGRF